MIERTLAIFKPETLREGKGSELRRRIEAAGLQIVRSSIFQPSWEQAAEHYRQYEGEAHFTGTVTALSASPVTVLVLEGDGAVQRWRDVMGPFRLDERRPGTIRGDFMTADTPNAHNYVHGSATTEEAEREIRLWFPDVSPANAV